MTGGRAVTDRAANPVGALRCKLRDATVEVVREHVALGPVPPGLRLWMFGSFARGDWVGNSDLDLFYVWPDAQSRRSFWRCRPTIEEFLFRKGVPRRVDLLEAIGQTEEGRFRRALGDALVLVWGEADAT